MAKTLITITSVVFLVIIINNLSFSINMFTEMFTNITYIIYLSVFKFSFTMCDFFLKETNGMTHFITLCNDIYAQVKDNQIKTGIATLRWRQSAVASTN